MRIPQLLCLVLSMLTLPIMRTNVNAISVDFVNDKRIYVTRQDEPKRMSKIQCPVACFTASWCMSANTSPAESTCQLFSVEVSRVTSLQSIVGWSYMRKCDCVSQQSYIVHIMNVLLNDVTIAGVDECARLAWSCANGGTVVDTDTSCECQCSPGYTGEHCQTGLL